MTYRLRPGRITNERTQGMNKHISNMHNFLKDGLPRN